MIPSEDTNKGDALILLYFRSARLPSVQVVLIARSGGKDVRRLSSEVSSKETKKVGVIGGTH